MLIFVYKFITFLCLPILGVWLFFAFAAAPFAGFLPGYFRMILASPLWFILSFFVALMGWKRRMGFWIYFLISLVFTPLVGMAAVLLSGKKKPEPEKSETPGSPNP
jgi:hypothetical protein